MKKLFFELLKEAILLEAEATKTDCTIKSPNLRASAKELRELADKALEEANKEAEKSVKLNQFYYNGQPIFSC